ncbi:MAG: hypothetical protein Greene071436_188, partial [Parcubacteria group bacterium Greene0714_36]
MGKLEELEESLYGREDKPTTGRERRQSFFPSPRSTLSTSWNSEKPRLGAVSRMPISKAMATAVLTGLLFVVGAGTFAFLYLGSERREARVTIGGRDSVEGGEIATIPVTFQNISAEALIEADLIITFPPDAFLQDESGRLAPATARVVQRVGTLAPGEEQHREFTVQFFGREGDEKLIAASLAYRPAGLRARFSSEAEKSVAITRVPIAISWDIPEIVAVGQEAPITVRFSSQARTTFDNLWLRMEYPAGFA